MSKKVSADSYLISLELYATLKWRYLVMKASKGPPGREPFPFSACPAAASPLSARLGRSQLRPYPSAPCLAMYPSRVNLHPGASVSSSVSTDMNVLLAHPLNMRNLRTSRPMVAAEGPDENVRGAQDLELREEGDCYLEKDRTGTEGDMQDQGGGNWGLSVVSNAFGVP